MKKNGFTLIELLATVILLGVIAGIAYPTYNNITNESKDNIFRDNVKSLIHNIRTIEVIEFNRGCGCIENLDTKGTKLTGYWKLEGDQIVLYEVSDGVRSVERVTEEQLTTNFDIERTPIVFTKDCFTICLN